MISNHLNKAANGEVYCHRLMKVVELTPDHFNEECARCSYFQGSNQGTGVECKYNDPNASNELMIVEDPYYQMERMTMLNKSARRGGVFNLNDEERKLFGVQELPSQQVMDEEQAQAAELEKLRVEQMLLRQDEHLLKKLKELNFDPDSPVVEIDVEQHMNVDEHVRRWVVDHPYFHGTVAARVSDVSNELNPTVEERGYYVRFNAVNRFNEFGAVTGPQRKDVLRRIGFFNDVPKQAPKLNMMYSIGALARTKRDGRVGQVQAFVEERGTLRIILKFLNISQAFSMDEVEPMMRKSAPDRDSRGRFAFMAINSPQPPSKDDEDEVPEIISATEAMHRVLSSKNHQKHLTKRDPKDREAWIARYKKLWIGSKPYHLQEVSLEKLDARPVDFNEETVQKYVDSYPEDKHAIIAPDGQSGFRHVILDGNHTVEAARRLGKKTIQAYVREDGLKKLAKAGTPMYDPNGPSANFMKTLAMDLGGMQAEGEMMKAAVFEETKHPRAEDGRFGTKPGAHGGKKDEGKEAPKQEEDAPKEGRKLKEIEYKPDPSRKDPISPSDLTMTKKEQADVNKLTKKGDMGALQERLRAIKDKLEASASPTARMREISRYADKGEGKSRKHYGNPETQWPDSDAYATVKIGDIDELVEGAKRHAYLKDWYNEFSHDVAAHFGQDAELFTTMLSATSPNAQVLSNVTLATKAYRQLKLGAPFEGYLPSVIKQLERIKQGKPIQGVKIAAFDANNKGDDSQVTLDMHMTRLFFGTSAPTEPQRRFMIDRIQTVSKKLGWGPAQVQAALWAWQLNRSGLPANTFSEGLARVRDEITWIKQEIESQLAQQSVAWSNPTNIKQYNEVERKKYGMPEVTGLHMKAAGEPMGIDQAYDAMLWQTFVQLLDAQIQGLNLGITLAQEVEKSHGGAS